MTQQPLNEGVAPGETISRYLIPAVGEVGDCFERNEFYVPELLIAVRHRGRPSHPEASAQLFAREKRADKTSGMRPG